MALPLFVHNQLRKSSIAAFLFLMLAGTILYANVLHAPFIFDDHFMLQHPGVRDIPTLLNHWQENPRKFLTYITFALNYHFNGENPFGYHFFNVFLHILTGFVFYCVVRSLFQTAYLKTVLSEKDKPFFALSAAMIFLVHPLQTESVTYIWQRSEVLSGFFYFAAYLCYLQGRLGGRRFYYLAAGVLYYIGLFAKGGIITLPLLIVLTEYSFWNLEKTRKRRLTVGLTVTLVVLTVLWSVQQLHVLLHKFGIGFVIPMPIPFIHWDYLLTQFKILLKYVQLALFPISQNFDHYFPLVTTSSFAREWPTVLAFTTLVGIFALTVRLFSRHRLISFGILWFFICLIPASLGIIRIESIGEHRLYISLAGFAIFLIGLLWTLIENAENRRRITVGIVLVLSFLTVNRNRLWQSPEALFRDTIAKSPLHPRPYNVLGEIYYKEGRLDEAKILFEKSVDLSWGWYPYSHYYLGLIHLDKGELEQAQSEFELILLNQSGFLPAHHSLAKVWVLKKNYQRAEEVWQRSLAVQPTAEAYYYLGQIYFLRKDFPQAERYYEKSRLLAESVAE